MIDFYKYNRDKDDRINNLIKNENLNIGKIDYETWLELIFILK